MSLLTLRAALTPDAHRRLADLARTIWHEHYRGIISEAQIEYMLEHGYSAQTLAAEQQAGTRFILAEYHDTLVGFAATTPVGTQAWLDKLYVHATARSTGVGRALAEDAIEFARRAGCECLRLRVNRDNEAAIAAYKRLGFVVDSHDIKDIGHGYVMDDYLMSQIL